MKKEKRYKPNQAGYVYQRIIELGPTNIIDHIFKGSGLHQLMEEINSPAIVSKPLGRKDREYQHQYYLNKTKLRRKGEEIK